MQVSNQKSIWPIARSGLRWFLEFLLPNRCPGCSEKLQSHGSLCPSCWADLTPLAAPMCQTCALPFEFEAEADSVCGACIKDPPEFDWACAAVQYEGLGRSIVLKLKHSASTVYVPVMAQMMVLSLGDKSPDIVMPVPLHAGRLIKRRFNQSQLLASALSKRLGISQDNFALKKVKATASQGGLGRTERFRNVSGSFRVSETAELTGKSILLVDDVLTTGATARACAKALKKAGAKEVGIVTFARVGKPVAG